MSEEYVRPESGLDRVARRERFEAACAAMTGLLGCTDFINQVAIVAGTKALASAQIAEWAVMQADALLAALKQAEAPR